MNITTTCHPFDASRVLTPMVTGLLPDSKPIISRGQVYCGHDFRQRAVAWYLAEQDKKDSKSLKTEEKTPKDTRAKSKWNTAPTRVQPPRAAKRKADSAPATEAAAAAAPPKKKLKIVLTKTPASAVRTPAPATSYTLSSVYRTATAAQFQAGLDIVLDTKRAALTSGCHWSTTLFPSPSPTPKPTPKPTPTSSPSAPTTTANWPSSGYSTPRSQWCPIVAESLACIDRVYCLHSIGRLAPAARAATPAVGCVSSVSSLSRVLSSRTNLAPEAAMSPPCTPPPEIVLRARAKEFAEMRHVQERTVEFGGLRFAVDVCDGSMRIWMV